MNYLIFISDTPMIFISTAQQYFPTTAKTHIQFQKNIQNKNHKQ